MPNLSPQTLTHREQKVIVRATRRNLLDHLLYSFAFGGRTPAGKAVTLDGPSPIR